MGGIYSHEEMEKQLLHNSSSTADRTTFDRIRIPFKLLCDNATQTDVPKSGGVAKCSCFDGGGGGGGQLPSPGVGKKDVGEGTSVGVGDDSHINFTSIYLSCHNTPSKCFCENYVQTEPVGVHTKGVQTENVSVGGFEHINHHATKTPNTNHHMTPNTNDTTLNLTNDTATVNLTNDTSTNVDLSDTTESDVYEDTVAYRTDMEQQWTSSGPRMDVVTNNSSLALKYQGKYSASNVYEESKMCSRGSSNSTSSNSSTSNRNHNDIVLQLDPIDNKYISSLSSDDEDSLDENVRCPTKTSDYFSQTPKSTYDNDRQLTDNDLDDELARRGSNYVYDDTDLFSTPCNYNSNKRGVLGNYDAMRRELPTNEPRRPQVMGPATGGVHGNSWKTRHGHGGGGYEGVVRRNKTSDAKKNKWKRYSAIEQRTTTNMWNEDDENDMLKGYLSDDNYTRRGSGRHCSDDDNNNNNNNNNNNGQMVVKGTGEGRFTDRETGFEEEFEIRHMLDVDYCWKCECLQQENKQMVTKYEHVIKELSDQSEDLLLTDANLNEAMNEREQLQTDLNKAESGLVDAYKRIERLKSVLDKYKNQENTMKVTLYDQQQKVNKSEERYKKLKRQALEKVEAANVEISRIQKDKSAQLEALQEELQRCRNRNMSLERELEQKSDTNKELSQICDELIKKVSDE